jgi:hypothetical protein
MELWIVLGLVVVAVGVGAASRLRSRRPPAAEETKNIYPLW